MLTPQSSPSRPAASKAAIDMANSTALQSPSVHTRTDNISETEGDRRSVLEAQRYEEARASMRLLMPEESNEVNWLLNLFDPSVSNIREVHHF